LLASDPEEAIAERAELLLYAADRAQHVETFIKPHLERGAIVVCDRYIESTIAYQGYGRGLDLELIHQLNQIASGGLMSDLTLWLDIEPEVGLSRAKRRGETNAMERETIAFHQRVRQGYAAIASNSPTLGFPASGHRFVRIDATPSIAIVQAQIQGVLREEVEG
jgi:dTMP kinase